MPRTCENGKIIKMKYKKSKKYIYLKAFIIAAVLIGVILYFLSNSPLSAAGFFNLPGGDSFGDVPDPEGGTAVEKTQNLIVSLMYVVRVLMGAIGILLIVLYGFNLVVTGHNEETVSKQKKALLWGIIGFALISVSASASAIFDFQQGSFLADEGEIIERAGIFDDRVTVIITLLKYVLGSVAIFMIVQSAFAIIVAGDKEEAITRERKQMIGGLIGIIIVIIAEFFVRRVIFKVDPNINYNEAKVTIDTAAGVSEIIAVTNFMVSFVGPVMVLGIVAGGLMYAFSAGDEEKATKAKKIMINSMIGVLIIYGAFAMVSTMITGVI